MGREVSVRAHPTPTISFAIGARAFDYLVDHMATLQAGGATAVEGAQRRGAVARSYYFVDAADEVARDVRNCLRRGAVDRDPDGRACDAAASAIENRRRVTWYGEPCPGCGGRFRPRDGLVTGVVHLVCESCHRSVPE